MYVRHHPAKNPGTTNLHLAGLPAGLASQARGSSALAIHAGGPVKATASTAFADGINTGLLVAAGAALLAAITVAALLPGGPHSRHAARRNTAGTDISHPLITATQLNGRQPS